MNPDDTGMLKDAKIVLPDFNKVKLSYLSELSHENKTNNLDKTFIKSLIPIQRLINEVIYYPRCYSRFEATLSMFPLFSLTFLEYLSDSLSFLQFQRELIQFGTKNMNKKALNFVATFLNNVLNNLNQKLNF
jgi:hypothetical protein